MNKNITATLTNHPNGFSISMPAFFHAVSKEDREDLIAHFLSASGTWNAGNKTWDFPSNQKVPVFNLLKVFGVRLTIHTTMENLRNPKFEYPSLMKAPEPVIIEKVIERPVQIQVPRSYVIGPQDPAVRRIIETNYLRVQNELLKLHIETGINKTKMRELLSKAVPAMITTSTHKV